MCARLNVYFERRSAAPTGVRSLRLALVVVGAIAIEEVTRMKVGNSLKHIDRIR